MTPGRPPGAGDGPGRAGASGGGPWRVVLVDDEPPARDALRAALEGHADFRVVAEAGDGEGALAAIADVRPDLVFLDVRMPGPDGLEVARRLPDPGPAVVFVTAYDDRAVEAFDVRAADYLVKPFEDARFERTLERLRRRLGGPPGRPAGGPGPGSGPRAETILARVEAALGAAAEGVSEAAAEPGPLLRVWVREDDVLRPVAVADVLFFEADGNHVLLHTGDARYRVRGSLRALEARLDPRAFVRVHRSTVVAVDRVREVQPWFSGDYVAILDDGRTLKVSRRYREGLLAAGA